MEKNLIGYKIEFGMRRESLNESVFNTITSKVLYDYIFNPELPNCLKRNSKFPYYMELIVRDNTDYKYDEDTYHIYIKMLNGLLVKIKELNICYINTFSNLISPRGNDKRFKYLLKEIIAYQAQF